MGLFPLQQPEEMGAMSEGKKVGTATRLAVQTFFHCAFPLCFPTFSVVTKPSKHIPSVNSKLHPQARHRADRRDVGCAGLYLRE